MGFIKKDEGLQHPFLRSVFTRTSFVVPKLDVRCSESEQSGPFIFIYLSDLQDLIKMASGWIGNPCPII